MSNAVILREIKEMINVSKITLFLFIIAMIFLIIDFHVTEYQDAWIYYGMESFLSLTILTLLFIFLTPIRRNLMLMIILSILLVLNLTPQLKYRYGYGVFDTIAHAGAIVQLINEGKIPDKGFYYGQYWDYRSIPGSHILISIISIIDGVSPYIISRLIISSLSIMIPLLWISIVRRYNVDNVFMHYATLASFFACIGLYIFSGAKYGYIMFSIIIYVFLIIILDSNKIKLKDYLVVLTIGIAMVFSHIVSTILVFLAFLSYIVSSLLSNIIKKEEKEYLREKIQLNVQNYCLKLLLILFLLIVIHLIYCAVFYHNLFFNFVKSLFLHHEAVTPLRKQLHSIGKYTIGELMRIIIVRNSNDLVFYLLSLVGMIITIRLKTTFPREIKLIKENIKMVILPLAFILFLTFRVGFYYQLAYDGNIKFLFTPLITIVFFYCNKLLAVKRHKLSKVIIFLISISLIITSIIQSYPLQPLLQEEKRVLVIYHNVNSVYQYTTIHYLSKYVASDVVIYGDYISLWQIAGFAPYLISKRLVCWKSIFKSMGDFDNLRIRNDERTIVAVIHTFGRAGPLIEFSNLDISKVNSFIIAYVSRNSLLFNCKESFIIMPLCPR